MNLDGALLIGADKQPPATVEVCRSFAYKLNLQNHGGNPYESADFFASRKIQCAAEDAEWVSQQIYEECVAEVRGCVAAFIDEMRRKKAGRETDTGGQHDRKKERRAVPDGARGILPGRVRGRDQPRPGEDDIQRRGA